MAGSLLWKFCRQVAFNSPFTVSLLSKCGCSPFRYCCEARFLCSGLSPTTNVHSIKPLLKEEDTPHVSAEVARLLELSKPTFVNGRYVKAKLSARRLAKLRKQYIAAGYYWPEKPLRDRSLDLTSKRNKREEKREARQKLIEENMQKMPQMIAEYRAKMRELRTRKRELKDKQKEKQIEAKRLGYNPKDPRGLQKLLQEEALEAKKKKRLQKKAQNQN